MTFIAVLFRAVYGVMTKVLSDKINTSPYTQAVLLSVSAGIIALIASPFLGGIDFTISNVNLFVVFLVISSQGVGNIIYFTAIKHLTNGTAQITFSSIILFNAVLAVVFLETVLIPLNYVGIALLLLAIYVATTGKIVLDRRGVGLMTLAALVFAVFQLSSAEMSQDVTAATYLCIAYFGAALVVFALKTRTVLSDFKNNVSKETFKVSFLTGLPSVGNFLFAYFAYRAAPEPAKAAMLMTSQVVFAVLFSYIFLKEHNHPRRKLLAAFLVVISAVLIRLE